MAASIVLGLIIGVVMRLTGAGGGILAVPLLTFGMDMTVSEAGPIGLLAVGMAAALGAGLGLKGRIVRYRAAILIGAAGMLSAPVGVWLAHRLDTRVLNVLFAAVLLLVAYRSYRHASPEFEFRDSLHQTMPCIRNDKSGRLVWTAQCAKALLLSGVFAGILSGLLGVGGGFVMVPALQRYTNLDMQSTVATSLTVTAIVSLLGVAMNVSSGHFNTFIGTAFSVGSLAGMVIGILFSARLRAAALKRAFAFICAIVAVGMIAKVALF
ncbi:MAG TPA: sulfite exporter TauE/SafE family protein [Noviherbaspirillum sp.]